MIVTCGSCLTKFHLDDCKISTKGTKVRCSRCQCVFLIMPPTLAKEEGREDVQPIVPCHDAPIPPDQKKADAPSPLKTQPIEKAAQGEKIFSSCEETSAEKAEQRAHEKSVKEERIKVKTFKIDNNSFRIEWNIEKSMSPL
ncbi:MAG: hypothetical protein FJ110_10915 [Deltaproteobacteria bacterium]|nr:hypothetical protein [Deltaproteobacteria bacterium]